VVLAQQPVRDPVERADREPAVAVRHQRRGARAHLARGLVRERHREHAPRRLVEHLGEPRDPVHEHARLARAGAGEHEVVTGGCGDRFALRGIERIEQVRDIHQRNCGA
jgi:hypothetical protein